MIKIVDLSKIISILPKIDLINAGNNYHSIPGITTLTSAYGKGGIFDIKTGKAKSPPACEDLKIYETIEKLISNLF